MKKITRREMMKLLAISAPVAYLPSTFAQTTNATATTNAPVAPELPLPPAPVYIKPPAGFGVAAGPFKPTWESLTSGYQVPDWFRDAKLGIWAHWGPQCQPEMGDWYAQKMYQPDRKSVV